MFCLHITCVQHVGNLYPCFTLNAHSMHTCLQHACKTCRLPANYIHMHADYLKTTCVGCMHTTCTLHVGCMHATYTACRLHAYYNHTTGSLHAYYMHTTCNLHAHYNQVICTHSQITTGLVIVGLQHT